MQQVEKINDEQLQSLADRGWLYRDDDGFVCIIDGLGWLHPDTALKLLDLKDDPNIWRPPAPIVKTPADRNEQRTLLSICPADQQPTK